MKSNVGYIDMGVRLVLAAVLLFVGLIPGSFVPAGLPQTLVLAAAVLLLLTATLRYCPFYGLWRRKDGVPGG